jgi:hypothetical protein
MRSIAWFTVAWLIAAALIPSLASASATGGDATVTLRATVRRHATVTLPPATGPFAAAIPRASSNTAYTWTTQVVWQAERPTLLLSVILD